MARTYYALLGVRSNASAQEIRTAYRRLIRQYHPDVNPGVGSEALVRELNAAYEVLGDPKRRRAYDHYLRRGQSHASAAAATARARRRASAGHHPPHSDPRQDPRGYAHQRASAGWAQGQASAHSGPSRQQQQQHPPGARASARRRTETNDPNDQRTTRRAASVAIFGIVFLVANIVVYFTIVHPHVVIPRERVNLNNQKLAVVPDGIRNQSVIHHLHLSHNKIDTISPVLATVPQLETLDLSNNQLRHLPPHFFELRNLRELFLEDNLLQRVPSELSQFRHLQILNLARNDLRYYAPAAVHLPELVILDLSYNELRRLPADLQPWQGQLGQLHLKGNPLPQAERQRIRAALPDTRIFFDQEGPSYRHARN
jgi:curved DNA-binding protein CbpA